MHSKSNIKVQLRHSTTKSPMCLMYFYVPIYVFDEIIRSSFEVVIMFMGIVYSSMKFGGQTFKKVHEVRKFCLETTLCVLACFIKFYVFVHIQV